MCLPLADDEIDVRDWRKIDDAPSECRDPSDSWRL